MSFTARKLGSVTAVLALAVGLTACSSDEGGDATGTESVFVDAIGTNPPHLNPQLSTDVATTSVTSAIYESLVSIDGEYELHPALAKSWESNEDATQYTFELEENVSWHDGEPFTAADVKFNFEEVIELHPLGGQITSKIASVETPDDFTVVVNLSEPFAPFAEALAGHEMLPAHIYEGTDIVTSDANMNPIGTGPFVFEEFIAGDRITVVKNEDYWQEAGDLQKVIFKIMPDANARVLALQSGEIDRVIGIWLDTAQVGTLQKDDAFYFTSAPNVPSVMSLFFNTREGILSDPAVRAALYTAMDRESIAANAYNGQAEASRGPIPEAIAWATDPEVDFREQFAFDLDEAGKMLDEAGYPADADGKRFDLRLNLASGFPTYTGTAEVIKSNLEELGISVDLQSEDLNIFVDKTYVNFDYDMSIMSFSVYQDPNLGISRLYVCNPTNRAFANPTGVCDAEVDEAFAQAGAVSDRTQRAEFLSQAEQRIAQLLHTVPIVTDQTDDLIRIDRWDGVEDFASVVDYDWAALSSK